MFTIKIMFNFYKLVLKIIGFFKKIVNKLACKNKNCKI